MAAELTGNAGPFPSPSSSLPSLTLTLHPDHVESQANMKLSRRERPLFSPPFLLSMVRSKRRAGGSRSMRSAPPFFPPILILK